MFNKLQWPRYALKAHTRHVRGGPCEAYHDWPVNLHTEGTAALKGNSSRHENTDGLTSEQAQQLLGAVEATRELSVGESRCTSA